MNTKMDASRKGLVRLDEAMQSSPPALIKHKESEAIRKRLDRLGYERGRNSEEYRTALEEWYKILREFGGSGEEPSDQPLQYFASEARNSFVELDNLGLIRRRKQYLVDFLGNPENTRVGTCYIPVIAVVHSLAGEDLTGRTIVEVGPGREGMHILKYFASRGAKVIGIDVDVCVEDYSIEFVSGCWEDLEGHMGGGKVDIIYTHNMRPNPEFGGSFEGDRTAFEEHVVRATDKVLVPSGVYIGHSVECDYFLPLAEFKKLGYSTFGFRNSSDVSHTFFPYGSSHRDNGWSKNIAKREREVREKVPTFGECVVIAQKS